MGLPSPLRPEQCPRCGAAAGEGLFCPQCGLLLPPIREYYRFLGLAPRLSLDPAGLQKIFYDYSRQLHPDRFQRKSPPERENSVEATAVLNDAYRTLKDPVERAEYLLGLQGFDVREQRSKDVPPELLEEVFELNMALEELKEGDASARGQIEEARAKFQDMRGEIDSELEGIYPEYDRAEDPALLARVRELLNKRRYVMNLVRDVEKEIA